MAKGCSSVKAFRNDTPPPPAGGYMQAPPADHVRVEQAAPIDPSSSFFMMAALNETARRATWDNTWCSLGMISSSYLSNVAALSAEQATIFEHNLGSSLD